MGDLRLDHFRMEDAMATVLRDRFGYAMGPEHRVRQLKIILKMVKELRIQLLVNFILSLLNEYERCCGKKETKE